MPGAHLKCVGTGGGGGAEGGQPDAGNASGGPRGRAGPAANEQGAGTLSHRVGRTRAVK